MYLGRGFHSFLQSANHPGSAKRACLPGLMFDPENTSNWTQESHSQVQTTAPTSGHPVPWLCFQDDLQLPPMLSFRHSWCCFFFFVFPKEVKWPSQVFLSVPPLQSAAPEGLRTRSDGFSPCSRTLQAPNRGHSLHCFVAPRQWATWEQDFLSDRGSTTKACLRVWQNTYWEREIHEGKWNEGSLALEPMGSPCQPPLMEFQCF